MPTLRQTAGLIRYQLRLLGNFAGIHPRTCPICKYQGRFHAFGDPPRWDALCPSCGCLERHRLLKLYLDRNPGIVRGRVVHFAPERAVASLLRDQASDYLSADLHNPADRKLDMVAIDLPDESVDLFVCSHILEHVDDAKALRELFRCLKPGGSVIIMIPVVEGWSRTYENPAAATDDERLLHFGQSDHVRRYGTDVRERIRKAGFALDEMTATGEECVVHGIVPGERVFVATKAA